MSLPKSWCVKNDGSKRFKYNVLAYMHKHDMYNSWYCAEKGSYCGYNGRGFGYSYEPFGTELTIEEFQRLACEFEYGDEVEVRRVRDGEYYSATFVGYIDNPAEEYRYIARLEKCFQPVGWKECRKPKLKWEVCYNDAVDEWYVRHMGTGREFWDDFGDCTTTKEEAQAIAKALNELEDEGD